MTRSAFFITAMTLALSAHVARADDAPTDAEKFYNQGQAAFDAKRFDEAVSAWERSYELSKEPDLLFNIGQAYRQRREPGDCASARDAYKKYLQLEPGSDQRSVVEGFVSEMERCATSAIPATTNVVPPPITKAPEAETAPDPSIDRGRTKRIAGVAVGGGGLVLLATGLYFGSRAASLDDEIARACAVNCDGSIYAPKDADGKRAERNQWNFYGAGGAAIVAGGFLYWLGMGERSPSTIVGVSPHVGGGSVTWSGSW